MKILIFMSGFFPGKKYGGPPVSVNNICKLLNEDIYIVCNDHDLGETVKYQNIENGWNKLKYCKVNYLSDSQYTFSYLENIIKEVNPDVIYLQSLYDKTTVPCLILAKKMNINLVLAPRGEVCPGVFNKKYKKIPYIFILRLFGFFNNIKIHSTSDIETNSIKKWLGVSEDQIYKIDSVPNIPEKAYAHNIKLSGKLNLIFVSRIVKNKNLHFALNCLQQIKGKDIVFDIYGPIEDQKYWELCLKYIEDMPKNIEVSYKGFIEHSNIHEVLSKYDALFFPTCSENYGQIIAESILSHTPILISDQTPWTDINEYKGGWALDLNNKESFIEKLLKLSNLNENDFIKLRLNLKKYIESKIKLEELKTKYFEMLLNEN